MALEQRLRVEAQTTGVPLNRLRKEAAFHRLLARLHRAAPRAWALKGGLALIARLGTQVRATKDADTNWRATRHELDETLLAVEDLDLADWFQFRVGDARDLQGEGEQGALRYPVSARLDGRLFEQLSLDVNVVGPHDSRPVDVVELRRNLFAFVDEPPLKIPMVTPGQQLGEKLHAYTRLYDDQTSSRAKDLFDMLLIADQVQLPQAAALAAVVKQTFEVRVTAWPPQLTEPPPDWIKPWQGFVAEYPLRWGDLGAAFIALHQFWEPILIGTAVTSDVRWQPDRWMWT